MSPLGPSCRHHVVLLCPPSPSSDGIQARGLHISLGFLCLSEVSGNGLIIIWVELKPLPTKVNPHTSTDDLTQEWKGAKDETCFTVNPWEDNGLDDTSLIQIHSLSHGSFKLFPVPTGGAFLYDSSQALIHCKIKKYRVRDYIVDPLGIGAVATELIFPTDSNYRECL